MTRFVMILCASLLFLVGCGRDDADQRPTAVEPTVPATAEDVDALALFQRIDADTAYLMANLATLPADMAELFWEPLESMANLQAQTYGEMAQAFVGEKPLVAALLRELGAITSIEEVRARGLEPNGYWAIHAISLYPVVHVQMTSATAFDAMLDRLAAEAETELPRRNIDDEKLIWIEMDNFGLALHHDGQFLTLALLPDNDALLRRVVNLDQPTAAYNPRHLQSFNQAREFTPHGSGFFEFERIVELLLDGDDELVVAARNAAGLGDMAADPACRNEFGALVNLMPRFSMGLTRVDRQELTMLGRLETESGLGQQLAAIADAPVAVESRKPNFLSAGMAFNMVAARDFGRQIVGGWVEHPPECPAFENIRDNAANWQLTLNRPIPPFVTNIQGFRLNLDELNMQGQMQVDKAAGTLAVFMRNPQMLLGMAQMFSPELAALDLTPGGEPQRLPAGMIPDMDDLEAWMALSSGAIGLAVGDGQKDRLTAALEPSTADSAIFSYSVNVAAYGAFMEKMMEQAAEQDPEAPADMPSFDFLTMMGDSYEDSLFSIRLTPGGIDFVSSSTLKQ